MLAADLILNQIIVSRSFSDQEEFKKTSIILLDAVLFLIKKPLCFFDHIFLGLEQSIEAAADNLTYRKDSDTKSDWERAVRETMTGELLTIQPDELKFIFELHKQISCSVRLINDTYDHVAFKVKTTSPKKYSVRPNTGIISPQSFIDVTITMQAQHEAPPEMLCKDKFLVQSVVAPQGTNAHDVSPDLFLKGNGTEIHDTKLKVVYVLPPQSDSAKNDYEQASSTQKSGVENGNFSVLNEIPNDASELKEKLTQIRATLATLTEERNSAVKSSQNLQHELATLAATKAGSSKGSTDTATSAKGFSLLFVFLVALLGILVGYLMHRTK
ncbi:hypothetical protein O6H91_10G075000 [Diphasiastrum complanatum]|uniref:Uncharacterized protein n=1 Tax=Diphasiastrum complanatum TaxID=34168 RepID=A0ACC2CII5_DIPCM|nr:hypothetical protein O6H91_10G075000 [Diphasiastrum complanatum]